VRFETSLAGAETYVFLREQRRCHRTRLL